MSNNQDSTRAAWTALVGILIVFALCGMIMLYNWPHEQPRPPAVSSPQPQPTSRPKAIPSRQKTAAGYQENRPLTFQSTKCVV